MVPPAAALIVAAGVVAALHVGKLPPAVPALQQALGLTLLQAGFLVSAVQGAGMLFGLLLGAVADGLGGRRSMVLGLALLALCSAAGAAAPSASVLLALRGLEGAAFLLAVLPAPGLLRQHVPPARLGGAMGWWSAYMPLATATALGLGPVLVGALGWRAWWALLALPTALAALAVARGLPARVVDRPAATGPDAGPPGAARGLSLPPSLTAATARASRELRLRIVRTLRAPGPWFVAVLFALYAAQWLAIVGFLPTQLAAAGLPLAAVAAGGAVVAAVNVFGNLAAGRLLQHGVSPTRLLALGFGLMAVCALAAYGPGLGPRADWGLPPAGRLAALALLSAVGGVVPATLFALAVRVAPGPDTLASTVGWMQQGSALGQFAGPPAVAAMAVAAGGWHLGWVVTGACCLLALALLPLLGRVGVVCRGQVLNL